MLMHHTASIIVAAFVFTGKVIVDQHLITIFSAAITIHFCSVCQEVLLTLRDGCRFVRVFIILVILIVEAVLQIEVVAYVPNAETPADVGCVMLSISHYICFVVAAMYLLQYKSLS